MIYGFIGITLVYLIALSWAILQWKSLNSIKPTEDNYKSVSILIPFRNEASNLDKLMKSIKELAYPREKLEVILVDDHSTDDSSEVLKATSESIPFSVQVLNLPETIYGKKEAIKSAVAAASHEVMLCTDADCIFNADWVQHMQAPFHTGAHFVSAPVFFTNQMSLLAGMLQIEFSSLIGIGGITIQRKKPVMSNGANMAFLKVDFEQLNVYDEAAEVPTGDDVFLMNAIALAYPGTLIFQKNQKASVFTEAPKSLKDFFQQRIRWASKWKKVGNGANSGTAVAVFLFHLMWITAIPYMFTEGYYVLAASLLLSKALVEFVYLQGVLQVGGLRAKFVPLVLLQLFYSFYVVFFAIVANFARYSWKERRYGGND